MANIFCDGSGYNGEVSGWCIYEEGKGPMLKWTKDNYTSNEAEYIAVIEALERALSGDIIFSDSRLVVSQLNNTWRVKASNLRKYHLRAAELLSTKNIEVRWVSREHNLAGLAIEKSQTQGENKHDK